MPRATNFASGHRYVVALRNLENAAGEEIEAPAAFRYYRDRVRSTQPLTSLDFGGRVDFRAPRSSW